MFSQQVHYFKDGLDRTYAVSLQPWRADQGESGEEGLVLCKTYARQTLQSIVDADEDPFHYSLIALWLDLYQRPWSVPRTLGQLIEELAARLANGDACVYLVDSPLWHGPGSDSGSSGRSA